MLLNVFTQTACLCTWYLSVFAYFYCFVAGFCNYVCCILMLRFKTSFFKLLVTHLTTHMFVGCWNVLCLLLSAYKVLFVLCLCVCVIIHGYISSKCSTDKLHEWQHGYLFLWFYLMVVFFFSSSPCYFSLPAACKMQLVFESSQRWGWHIKPAADAF